MRGRRPLLVSVLVVAAVAGCDGPSREAGTSTVPPTVAPDDDGSELAELLYGSVSERWRSIGNDLFEVWICHVPLDETSSLYNDSPLRLPLTPDSVAEVLTTHVVPYFDELSHGQYRPVFVAGGEATLSSTADPHECVDEAIAGAAAATRAVLVVADAEHGPDQLGGFGNLGRPCDLPTCGVRRSDRYVYVGASDFHPDRGDDPPMDLVEHEIGHTLGWDHSAIDEDGAYTSALDVMSNPALPREMSPERRDAQGTLAINLFAAGWLPEHSVWVVPDAGGDVVLSPSIGESGVRLAVVELDLANLLTIERLDPTGLNDHLPASGVAVHRVHVVEGRVVETTPVFGEPPYTDLLEPGDRLEFDGWLIEVGDAGQVSVAPSVPKP
jgi:hypothetical protein